MNIVNSTLSYIEGLNFRGVGPIELGDIVLLGVVAATLIYYAPEIGKEISNLKGKVSKVLADRKLRAAVAKIDALIIEGKKVCLFIGRAPKEKLPTETGEAKENEVWVSGDISDEGITENPERIHLHADFNSEELTPLLANKFARIVIDLSTTKFLYNDFAKRFGQMLRDSTSKIIMSDSNGQAFPIRADREPENANKEMVFCKNSYSLRIEEKIYFGEISYDRKLIEEFYIREYTNHLKTRFHRETHFANTDFPYKFSESGVTEYITVKESHFILSNPK